MSEHACFHPPCAYCKMEQTQEVPMESLPIIPTVAKTPDLCDPNGCNDCGCHEAVSSKHNPLIGNPADAIVSVPAPTSGDPGVGERNVRG